MASKQLHLETLFQQELCKMYSSDFNPVTKGELPPFLAAMRLVKVQYAATKPEVYKMIVAILHDYNPNLGEVHRQKTARYIRILLGSHPDLADFLVNILPQFTAITKSGLPIVVRPEINSLHNSTSKQLPVLSEIQSEFIIHDAKRQRKENETKCYNYTPPVVSAYVASQGIPSKITTLPPKGGNAQALTMALTQTPFPLIALSQVGVQPAKESVVPMTMCEGTGHNKVLLHKDVERNKPMTPGLSNITSQVVTAASYAPRITGTITLDELKTVMGETRNVVDLSTLPIVKPLPPALRALFAPIVSDKCIKAAESATSCEIENQSRAGDEQFVEIIAEEEANVVKASTSSDTVVSSQKKVNARKYVRVQTPNITQRSTGKPSTSSSEALLTGNSLPRNMIQTTTVDPLPAIPKFNNLRTVSGRSSSAFPYQQQITLANGTSQNFIIDRSNDPDEQDVSGTWHPPCSSVKDTKQASSGNQEQQINKKLEQIAARDVSSPVDITAELITTDLSREMPCALDLCTKTPRTSPSNSLSDGCSLIDIEKTSSSQLLSSQSVDQLDSDSASSQKPLCPGHDISSDEEHLLYMSQMDGTSDHGNFSQSGSCVLDSPDIGSHSGREYSPIMCDDQKNEDMQVSDGMHRDFLPHSPKQSINGTRFIPAKDSDTCKATAQKHTPLTTEAVKRLDYLSRLIDTPSPPNYANQWGIDDERKPRPRSRPQGQAKRKRKIRE